MQPDPPTGLTDAVSTDLVHSHPSDLAPPNPKPKNRFKNEDGTWKEYALLSVFHKDGIIEFARGLVALGWPLLSSGGTAKHLREAGLTVTDVAEVSGLAACLDHKVVTLVPQVHGGLLAMDADLDELERLGWPKIGLACIDLYPLKAEVEHVDATRESVIKKTDIGGPTMLRSAAKGRRITVCDPADRPKVLQWLEAGRPEEEEYVTVLCAKTEGVIADYCLTSARYHSFGRIDGVIGTRRLECKYGENAPQTPAALFTTGTTDPLGLDRFAVVAGTPPSYNNLCDLDRMLQTATHLVAGFGTHLVDIAIAVKHGNPCGAAAYRSAAHQADSRTSRKKLLADMIEGDMRAIFGGLMLVNFAIDEEYADVILTHRMEKGRRLLDGIIAPFFAPEAIELLRRKGDKCRFLANPALSDLSPQSLDATPRFRAVRGGFLRQPNYTFVPDWTALAPHPDDDADIRIAWAIGATSNSNTITLVKDGMLIGNGVGQQDRVGGCELALKRARDSGHVTTGAVAYSDSFFPFPDGPTVLIEAGVSAIFATSGSVNDDKTRKVCEDANVRLYLLPDAEARGFFGH